MVRLEPLNKMNWHACSQLKVAPDQQKYIPDNLFSIAQAAFEPCEAFAVFHEETLVGFVLLCCWSDVWWLTRIMIAEAHQGNGYGGQALDKAIEHLRAKPGVTEVRTTIANSNALAEHLFTERGFERTLQLDDKEFVMRLDLTPRR